MGSVAVFWVQAILMASFIATLAASGIAPISWQSAVSLLLFVCGILSGYLQRVYEE